MTTRHTLVRSQNTLRVTDSDPPSFLGIVPHLLHALREAGIITEDLALPDDSNATEAVYRGLCKLPDTVDEEGKSVRRLRRRIDILSTPWQNRGAALLYYTVRRLNVDLRQILTLSNVG
jgi:DNA polymerase lambda